jgi:hypothetical protein
VVDKGYCASEQELTNQDMEPRSGRRADIAILALTEREETFENLSRCIADESGVENTHGVSWLCALVLLSLTPTTMAQKNRCLNSKDGSMAKLRPS